MEIPQLLARLQHGSSSEIKQAMDRLVFLSIVSLNITFIVVLTIIPISSTSRQGKDLIPIFTEKKALKIVADLYCHTLDPVVKVFTTRFAFSITRSLLQSPNLSIL
jgi:hypothetical protein